MILQITSKRISQIIVVVSACLLISLIPIIKVNVLIYAVMEGPLLVLQMLRVRRLFVMMVIQSVAMGARRLARSSLDTYAMYKSQEEIPNALKNNK